MKRNSLLLFCGLISITLLQCSQKNGLTGYTGTPFKDSIFVSSPQSIPGKLECEYYDFGGEGISFHDTDFVNSGSGRLNPINGTYLNGFRSNESVDISYTKTGGIDDNPYNMVNPELGKLYLGWTEPGEWVRYTVDVKKQGKYKIGINYTSNRGGAIGITVNNDEVKDSIQIPSTFNSSDTVPWRQWHHWNHIENVYEMSLKKGIQVITLHTLKNGNMNYDYLEFKEAE